MIGHETETAFIEIAGRRIGPGEPTYVIAELSANHNQDYGQAVEILRAAHAAGADAVKLQTYTADTLTIDSEAPPFRIEGGLWGGQTLHQLYRQAYTPWEWQPELKRVADELEMALFSSPFDSTAVEFLEEMDVPAYKIASFELVDTALLRRVAATGKPVIISTGMATLEEITEAVETLRGAGATQVAVLKCTSAYPAPPEEMNLRTIRHLAQQLKVPVGLSDHTLGISAPTAAVALGACIIEKHFTLSRATPGPDNSFSLEPAEFKALVESVRFTEKALGSIHYGVSESEARNRIFRRSLFVVKDVKAGEVLTHDNVRSIRPAHGLPPKYLDSVIGRRAAQSIDRGTPLRWELLA